MKEKVKKSFNEGELNYISGINSFDEIFKEVPFSKSKFIFEVHISESWMVFSLNYKKYNILYELNRSKIINIDLVHKQLIEVRDLTLDKRIKQTYLTAVTLGILISKVDKAFHDGGYDGALKGMDSKKIDGTIYSIDYYDEDGNTNTIKISVPWEYSLDVTKSLDKLFNYNLKRHNGKGCSVVIIIILTLTSLLSILL